MAGFLNVGEMGALALHAMLEVAKKYKEDHEARISVTQIAGLLDASAHTLHKVVKRLVESGLLESARGPAGGVRLREDPGAITLLRIIEAVDGPVNAGGCLFARRVCRPHEVCRFCGLTSDLERLVHNYFSQTTLEELLGRLTTPIVF